MSFGPGVKVAISPTPMYNKSPIQAATCERLHSEGMRFKTHQEAVIAQDKHMKKAQSTVSLHTLQSAIQDPAVGDRFEMLYNDAGSRLKKQEVHQKQAMCPDDGRHMTFMPGLVTDAVKGKLSAMSACSRLYNDKDKRHERAVDHQAQKEVDMKKTCPFKPELIPRVKVTTDSPLAKSALATIEAIKAKAPPVPSPSPPKKKRPASARLARLKKTPSEAEIRPTTNAQAERMKLFSRQKILALGEITLDEAKATWHEYSRPMVHNVGYVDSFGSACDTRAYLHDGKGDKSRVVGGVGTAQI